MWSISFHGFCVRKDLEKNKGGDGDYDVNAYYSLPTQQLAGYPAFFPANSFVFLLVSIPLLICSNQEVLELRGEL